MVLKVTLIPRYFLREGTSSCFRMFSVDNSRKSHKNITFTSANNTTFNMPNTSTDSLTSVTTTRGASRGQSSRGRTRAGYGFRNVTRRDFQTSAPPAPRDGDEPNLPHASLVDRGRTSIMRTRGMPRGRMRSKRRIFIVEEGQTTQQERSEDNSPINDHHDLPELSPQDSRTLNASLKERERTHEELAHVCNEHTKNISDKPHTSTDNRFTSAPTRGASRGRVCRGRRFRHWHRTANRHGIQASVHAAAQGLSERGSIYHVNPNPVDRSLHASCTVTPSLEDMRRVETELANVLNEKNWLAEGA